MGRNNIFDFFNTEKKWEHGQYYRGAGFSPFADDLGKDFTDGVPAGALPVLQLFNHDAWRLRSLYVRRSASSLARALNIPQRTVEDHLRALKKASLIRVHEKDETRQRGNVYFVEPVLIWSSFWHDLEGIKDALAIEGPDAFPKARAARELRAGGEGPGDGPMPLAEVPQKSTVPQKSAVPPGGTAEIRGTVPRESAVPREEITHEVPRETAVRSPIDLSIEAGAPRYQPPKASEGGDADLGAPLAVLGNKGIGLAADEIGNPEECGGAAGAADDLKAQPGRDAPCGIRLHNLSYTADITTDIISISQAISPTNTSGIVDKLCDDTQKKLAHARQFTSAVKAKADADDRRDQEFRAKQKAILSNYTSGKISKRDCERELQTLAAEYGRPSFFTQPRQRAGREKGVGRGGPLPLTT